MYDHFTSRVRLRREEERFARQNRIRQELEEERNRQRRVEESNRQLNVMKSTFDKRVSA